MLTPEENALLTHTGPGTLAGRYLRMFWQPVFRTRDLEIGHAVPVRLLSEDFALYRDQAGAAHLVEARCPHRGTHLAVGWVEDDCIRCRYHGWRFAASGQCVEQPGEDEAFAAKISIRTYPTQEYLGLVFAYLGDAPAPELKRYPDFERPGIFEVDPPEVWPCNYFNRIDNDVYHQNWTHRATTSRMDQLNRLAIPKVHAEETEYGVRNTTESRGQRRHFFYHMPNVLQLHNTRVKVKGYTEAPLVEDRLIFKLPVDDDSSIAFDVNLISGVPASDAERFVRLRREEQETDVETPYAEARAVLAGKKRIEDVADSLSYYQHFWVEDYVTEVSQGVVADRTREHLGRMDVGVIAFRTAWLRELNALAEGRPLKDWRAPEGLAKAAVEVVG